MQLLIKKLGHAPSVAIFGGCTVSNLLKSYLSSGRPINVKSSEPARRTWKYHNNIITGEL